MIIITTPRLIGELGRHLGRTGRGSNKEVLIRADMIRDVPADTKLALRIMAALARRNRRVKRDIVHLKIAPKRPLGPEGLDAVPPYWRKKLAYAERKVSRAGTWAIERADAGSLAEIWGALEGAHAARYMLGSA